MPIHRAWDRIVSIHRPPACRAPIHRGLRGAGVASCRGVILEGRCTTAAPHGRTSPCTSQSLSPPPPMFASMTMRGAGVGIGHLSRRGRSSRLDPRYRCAGHGLVRSDPPGSAHTEAVSPALDTTASAEPSPATCSCSEDPTEEGPVREGMYGPMHWLDDRHVTALLSPYICEGWDTGDYARFADLSGADARRLRSLLPPLARSDRQTTRRASPTCCAPPPASTVSRSKDMSSALPAGTSASASTPCACPSRRSSHTRDAPSTTPPTRPTSTGSPSPTSSGWATTPSHPTRCVSSPETQQPRAGGGHGGTNQLP